MSDHYYQLQLATEITVAAIENGLSVSNAEEVVKFYDKICETIEQRRIKWEDELTSTIEVADDIPSS